MKIQMTYVVSMNAGGKGIIYHELCGDCITNLQPKKINVNVT
jgi:hypothetical protein